MMSGAPRNWAPYTRDASRLGLTMLPATPQRTAEKRSLAPTPMIALEITWVVDTGIPKCEAV